MFVFLLQILYLLLCLPGFLCQFIPFMQRFKIQVSRVGEGPGFAVQVQNFLCATASLCGPCANVWSPELQQFAEPGLVDSAPGSSGAQSWLQVKQPRTERSLGWIHFLEGGWWWWGWGRAHPWVLVESFKCELTLRPMDFIRYTEIREFQSQRQGQQADGKWQNMGFSTHRMMTVGLFRTAGFGSMRHPLSRSQVSPERPSTLP